MAVIRVSDKVKKELAKMKIHPRQSYSEVIEELIKKVKENESNR
jgi:predicted CopG family antitoxin